ncbi:hypothetical protein O181_090391 [Austropuccinia psidii MF-1]|uniref:Helicase-associated domain-containing protein n=1 Tax=Austropuccinia psidii MF-1 TaxID=1389203 RepID=A0A9Q3IVB2_9BASI|nr:hypothetical protein [Austropuccinia psidii MF-1]
MQAKIFEPKADKARKVVLPTHIAETSITIDGVIYAIGPGFVKENPYNPCPAMESLVVVPCFGAAANQCAGRVEEYAVPEIQTTNIANVVRLLKPVGINDLIAFDCLDPRPGDALNRPLDLVYALGALNNRSELTKNGPRMAEFPMDGMFSKAILESEKHQCTKELLLMASMLSESRSIFYRPKDKALHADCARLDFVQPGGDPFTHLHAISWLFRVNPL